MKEECRAQTQQGSQQKSHLVNQRFSAVHKSRSPLVAETAISNAKNTRAQRGTQRTQPTLAEQNDFFYKTVVVATVSFLLLEAFLPGEYKNLSFLFLILESTLIYVLSIIPTGIVPTASTARLLITYIALAALIQNEKEDS